MSDLKDSLDKMSGRLDALEANFAKWKKEAKDREELFGGNLYRVKEEMRFIKKANIDLKGSLAGIEDRVMRSVGKKWVMDAIEANMKGLIDTVESQGLMAAAAIDCVSQVRDTLDDLMN